MSFFIHSLLHQVKNKNNNIFMDADDMATSLAKFLCWMSSTAHDVLVNGKTNSTGGFPDLPPVTSHMAFIGDPSTLTMLLLRSLSTGATPGMRSTSEKSRWSQRKGSLVSSLPGMAMLIGNSSYGG